MTDQRDELNWLAQQYVLGELDAEAAGAFEARLADDEAAGVALAQAVQLVAVLQTVQPERTERSTRIDWRRLSLGLAATAAAGAAVWLLPQISTTTQEEVSAAPLQAAELVSRWREAPLEGAPGSDRWTDEELDGGDDVPNWLLAAVSLEAGRAADNSVQEN